MIAYCPSIPIDEHSKRRSHKASTGVEYVHPVVARDSSSKIDPPRVAITSPREFTIGPPEFPGWEVI